MNAIRVGTTIDEAVARAIPALRPLLGKRVELIALDECPGGAPSGKLSVDELLASRIKLPPGVRPLEAFETGTADFPDYFILESSRDAGVTIVRPAHETERGPQRAREPLD